MDHHKAGLSFQGFIRVVDLQGRPSSCPLRPLGLGDIKKRKDEFPAGVCDYHDCVPIRPIGTLHIGRSAS
jgi:hypothetical protein